MCQLFNVKGRVQGVFFRDSTRRVAQRLGITGHAKNLRDGSVEVLACGPGSETQELLGFLRVGPRNANVQSVDESPVDCQAPTTFQIG